MKKSYSEIGTSYRKNIYRVEGSYSKTYTQHILHSDTLVARFAVAIFNIALKNQIIKTHGHVWKNAHTETSVHNRSTLFSPGKLGSDMLCLFRHLFLSGRLSSPASSAFRLYDHCHLYEKDTIVSHLSPVRFRNTIYQSNSEDRALRLFDCKLTQKLQRHQTPSARRVCNVRL